MFLAAVAVVALASCNNASPKMDEQPVAADNNNSGSRNCRTTGSPVVSRQKASRQPSSVSSRAYRNFRLVWRTNWLRKLPSTTKLFAIR